MLTQHPWGMNADESDEQPDADELADREECFGPSQDDINEGICIDERGCTVAAVYERKVIATGDDHEMLFGRLRDLEMDLCSPRIFGVNDHGNTTEYDYDGNVMGSWV